MHAEAHAFHSYFTYRHSNTFHILLNTRSVCGLAAVNISLSEHDAEDTITHQFIQNANRIILRTKRSHEQKEGG